MGFRNPVTAVNLSGPVAVAGPVDVSGSTNVGTAASAAGVNTASTQPTIVAALPSGSGSATAIAAVAGKRHSLHDLQATFRNGSTGAVGGVISLSSVSLGTIWQVRVDLAATSTSGLYTYDFKGLLLAANEALTITQTGSAMSVTGTLTYTDV